MWVTIANEAGGVAATWLHDCLRASRDLLDRGYNREGCDVETGACQCLLLPVIDIGKASGLRHDWRAGAVSVDSERSCESDEKETRELVDGSRSKICRACKAPLYTLVPISRAYLAT